MFHNDSIMCLPLYEGERAILSHTSTIIDSTHSVVKYVGAEFSPIFVEEHVTEVKFCSVYGCPRIGFRGRKKGVRFCELHYTEWARFCNRMAQRRFLEKHKK